LKGPKQHDPDAEKDDLLALGEKALYIEDPQDRSNRPTDAFRGAWLLGEEVEGLMRQAFTAGLHNPGMRPLAAQWSDALQRMTEQAVPCSNADCEGKLFILLRDQPAICPWCGTKVARPAQVPILQLYDSAGQAGHYQPGRGRVVGWHSRTLHHWHVQPGISASSAANRKPMAEFKYKQGKWMLENVAISDLRIVASNGVSRIVEQELITLEHGQQLILGTGQSARLALVVMQKL
jgi:hypothetical protein